jgi:uroporphyrinogen-III decarboxylase
LNLDIIDLDWMVDLVQAREILGENVVIKGNINPVFIQEATIPEIEIAVNEVLVKLKIRNSFCLEGVK